MPADRRVMVLVSATGTRDSTGEFVDGDVTTIGLWASRRDKSQEDIVEEGGVIGSTRRDWRIRWDSRIADVPVRLIDVVDGC